jgi:hypothetical protein
VRSPEAGVAGLAGVGGGFVGQEHRAALVAREQLGEQAGGFGVPEDPFGRAAFADELGLAVGHIEVLDVDWSS